MKRPKRHSVDDQVLDAEEMEIEAALERGEFVSDKPRAQALEEWQQAVRNTLRKKPITVRVQEQDIARIKAKALEQGIPYQTLVASVLHRYARGSLKEDA
jgi:predicted DNA binding CopG/RHH family protein